MGCALSEEQPACPCDAVLGCVPLVLGVFLPPCCLQSPLLSQWLVNLVKGLCCSLLYRSSVRSVLSAARAVQHRHRAPPRACCAQVMWSKQDRKTPRDMIRQEEVVRPSSRDRGGSYDRRGGDRDCGGGALPYSTSAIVPLGGSIVGNVNSTKCVSDRT